jgi:hypothetical protein
MHLLVVALPVDEYKSQSVPRAELWAPTAAAAYLHLEEEVVANWVTDAKYLLGGCKEGAQQKQRR